ncbi:hypothetical protein [Streptomyces sp. NPDC004830]
MSGTSGSTMPGVEFCSLKVDTPQLIAPGSAYKVVRFPFGAGESTDRWEMHQAVQPDGYVVSNWARDDRSGLIWPSKAGLGQLYALLQWEARSRKGGYEELRDQFVRDPLGLTPRPDDTTATEHRVPSPGRQFFAKHWAINVDPRTPLALRVTHDDAKARLLLLAEFKLVIHHAG